MCRRARRAGRAYRPGLTGRIGAVPLRAARRRGAAAARLRSRPLGFAARSAGFAVLRGGHPGADAARGRRDRPVITATFRHIAGIGPMRERQLWMRGVRSWSEIPDGEVLSTRLDDKLRAGAAISARHLSAGDLAYFAKALPQTEHWRLLPHVLEGAAYLDIEAAGDQITVIGVLDGRGIVSLQPDAFLERAREWTAMVTFNGAAFDLPILRRVFPEWQPPAVHVDLRHVYQRL